MWCRDDDDKDTSQCPACSTPFEMGPDEALTRLKALVQREGRHQQAARLQLAQLTFTADPEAAIAEIKRLADEGSGSALFILGGMHRDGNGVPLDGPQSAEVSELHDSRSGLAHECCHASRCMPRRVSVA
jgi:hypothetical protein